MSDQSNQNMDQEIDPDEMPEENEDFSAFEDYEDFEESTLPSWGEPSLDIVQKTLDTFLGSATVDSVYGPAIEKGDSVIIPTAEVLSVLGFATASGYRSNPEQNEKNGSARGGSGGGGGGKVFSRPVAVVVASSEGVRIEPVIDITKISLAALTAAGFMVGMLVRMLRNPQSQDDDCCS